MLERIAFINTHTHTRNTGTLFVVTGSSGVGGGPFESSLSKSNVDNGTWSTAYLARHEREWHQRLGRAKTKKLPVAKTKLQDQGQGTV